MVESKNLVGNSQFVSVFNRLENRLNFRTQFYNQYYIVWDQNITATQ